MSNSSTVYLSKVVLSQIYKSENLLHLTALVTPEQSTCAQTLAALMPPRS